MVANLPLRFAAADALYAAGLGLLLACLFTCVRMLLPGTKPFLFICDFCTLCLAGLLYQSVAIARFYSGIARWYTILALILGYAAWLIAAHSKLVYLARLIKFAVLWPFALIYTHLLNPVFGKLFVVIKEKHKKNIEKRIAKRKKRTKQLQNTPHMLYNSK